MVIEQAPSTPTRILPKVVLILALIVLAPTGIYLQYQSDLSIRPDAAGPDLILQFWIQLVVSLILLPETAFVIFSNRYQAKDRHWAYGTLGMIVGFWLK